MVGPHGRGQGRNGGHLCNEQGRHEGVQGLRPEDAGYILFITADHGNAEQMINPAETDAPHTAHTTIDPVRPFIMTGDPKKFHFTVDKKDGGGRCADVLVALTTFYMTQGLPKPEGECE
ncbi:uncharacterized protein LAESUDRAFT_810124 [Laetiporus sulphureus 93-53]|uniref:Metalloenzyme domain-containing protein n=1 Tax=Laetiporus sulphureus 93-53 TaxID=1314785 RepID=A0A165GLD4_9APHY|nr:uncharacterized protein LAESUDRAFT_810124 [Laetiporus sulphureus 93-53]KZT10511.1 hypothetical protein LAESUDRAFT_810124 [Laetiporus sulphureus 93-53]